MFYECPFCEEYSGTKIAQNSRLIYADGGYALVPTVGCFTEGYCLYLPTKHVTSFAFLGKVELTRVQDELYKISDILKREYSSELIMAEHGAGSETKCGASCINHAHIHLIPVNDSLMVLKQFLNVGGPPTILNSMSDLSVLSGEPYIYLNWRGDKFLVWTNTEKFPRQFVRSVCATLHGLPDMWNWRMFPFYEEMKATTARLKHHFAFGIREIPIVRPTNINRDEANVL